MSHSTIAAIWALFQEKGQEDYHGEAVSQIEHALQAAQIAIEETGDLELSIAALFHDVGHLLTHTEEMEGFGTMHHEALGANFLREQGFSENVVRLVGGHVAAKRYLCFSDPVYYEQLSEASQATLRFQGGVMVLEEAMRFQRDPLFAKHILLRRIDERAKIADLPVPTLDFWKNIVETHLDNQTRTERVIW